MCGILITNSDITGLDNTLLDFRGPDYSQTLNKEGVTFLQTLLSITGEFTKQPIEKDGVVFLFNGEVYNYNLVKNYPSDIYFIIDMYFKYGEDYVKHLDGEFAIVIADYKKNILYFASDIFGTKPIHYSIKGGSFGISSYREPLNDLKFSEIKRAEPSTLYKVDLKTNQLIEKKRYFNFKLEQTKTDFNDWEDSFLEAIKKRFKNIDKEVILPLSSGFDSGAILCAFNILDIKFHSFSFYNYEHKKVLDKRIQRVAPPNKSYKKEKLTPEERDYAKNLIKSRCSDFFYGPDLNDKNYTFNGLNDAGSHGLAYLLDYIKKENPGIKIMASGHGADEIMSNIQTYTFGKPNPENFPKNLEEVFPWENFYIGTQSSYLYKEESISGGFGIEGRYPFLDKDVVQEYLFLDSKLKNSTFKSPIVNFLKRNKFPYRKKSFRFPNNENLKSGFNA